MGIKLDSQVIIPEYNTDKKLDEFIPLVIKHAPKYDNFSISDLRTELNLSKTDQLIFNDLTLKIRQYFVRNDIAEMYGSNQIKLLDKGRNVKSGKEKILGKFIYNDFSNSSVGTLIQDSDLNKARIKSQINNDTHPTKNPSKWAIIKSFLGKFWWQILIPLIIGIVLILIERGNINIGI
jgi:hypothetical protein